MPNQPQNFGFVEPTLDSEQFIVGSARSLNQEIINPDRDWRPWRVKYEPQFFKDGRDSYGCGIWGTQNAIEVLEKKLTGVENNYSERAPYIDLNVEPPGTDPHKVAEYFRKNGLLPDDLLPMTETYEEFISPNTLPSNLKSEAKKWLNKWQLQHEWVFTGGHRLQGQLIYENLQYGTLCGSFTAWYEEDGVYVDNGLRNTHWCLIEYCDKVLTTGKTKYYPHVFDSFDHSQKIISADHKIFYVKRYNLEPVTNVYNSPSFWQWLLSIIRTHV